MRRRSFLSLLGAAVAAPAIPALPAPAAAATGYNRYQYGLAVFHARTRASVTAADLVGRLKVGTQAAQAIVSEMTASGVVAPATSSAAGAFRAVDSLPMPRGRSVGTILRETADLLDRDLDSAKSPMINSATAPDAVTADHSPQTEAPGEPVDPASKGDASCSESYDFS